MAIVAAASTAKALVVHVGPKLARLAFSRADELNSQREFDSRGLHNQAGVVPFSGENGGSTPTPRHGGPS